MGIRLLLIISLLLLSGCDVIGFAEECQFGADKNNVPRVLNPEQCEDKPAVKYLNCWDKSILPKEQRPKECQQD